MKANINSKYYIHTSNNGLNECIEINNGSVLPNCVGYAWGRVYEVTGKRPNLSLGDAKDWFNFNDGYERGKTPKAGSIACFKGGQYGHVAYVENVLPTGDIKISESNYNGAKFNERYLYKSMTFMPFYDYELQGFIYINDDVNESVSNTNKNFTPNKSYDLKTLNFLGETGVVTKGYFKKAGRRLYLQTNANTHKHNLLIDVNDVIYLTSWIGVADEKGINLRVPAFHPKSGKVGYVTYNYNQTKTHDFHAIKYIPFKKASLKDYEE